MITIILTLLIQAKACDQQCDIMYAQLMSITTGQYGSVEEVCAQPKDRRIALACMQFKKACGGLE